MKIQPLGDCAFIVRDLQTPAHDVASWLNDRKVPGLEEAVASYGTVGLYVDGNAFTEEALEAALAEYEPPELLVARRHEIPVCYELGEDLMDVAKRLDMTPIQLVHLHCARPYRCYAVGFSPGFPYLGYLPDALSGLPRRPEPRVRVPAGSVAITGNQTGIYTVDRPGGWHLIGKTPLELVNVEGKYFPISAGDEIAFVPITITDYDGLEGKRL